ncbi:MAG: LysM peptidoglycan-binding domain-containing protein [Proteobacteria bacterium]|nr:MAG: LysM peptidoglycan-binding domain-containing protein [Pseudomonadota bacterium]
MRASMKISVAVVLPIALAAGGCSMLQPPASGDLPAENSPRATITAPMQLTFAEFEDSDVLLALRARFRLPRLENAEVRYYERWYREHPEAILRLTEQARWHLPSIARAVIERGLPGEIALLPAVESGFDANAQSSSGAAGLWQFTSTTARHFGLAHNAWRDERRNLEASTGAALDYLEQLNSSFHGDWLLALAAYNAGEGTVRKLMKKSRMSGTNTDYRRLRLPTETRHFVPKLIALTNVVRDPSAFGISLPRIDRRPPFVVVRTEPRVGHRQIASFCGVDEDVISQLNAWQLKRSTPPDGPFEINLPRNCAARFDLALLPDRAAEDALAARTDTSNYTVRHGDSLWRIADDNGVTLSALRDANPGIGPALMPGQMVRIPRATSIRPDASREVVHNVSPGDTLWRLARRYRVSANSIADWNRIAKDGLLSLGQSLRIYLD